MRRDVEAHRLADKEERAEEMGADASGGWNSGSRNILWENVHKETTLQQMLMERERQIFAPRPTRYTWRCAYLPVYAHKCFRVNKAVIINAGSG